MTNTMTNSKIKVKVDMKVVDIRWGDILYVDFGEGVGSEQGGVRPAVVVGNNKGNSNSPCTLVAPMTSEEKTYIPTHILVYPTKASGLKRTSTIMFEQTRAIDKTRILSKVGHLDAESLVNKIENSLNIAFSRNFA